MYRKWQSWWKASLNHKSFEEGTTSNGYLAEKLLSWVRIIRRFIGFSTTTSARFMFSKVWRRSYRNFEASPEAASRECIDQTLKPYERISVSRWLLNQLSSFFCVTSARIVFVNTDQTYVYPLEAVPFAGSAADKINHDATTVQGTED